MLNCIFSQTFYPNLQIYLHENIRHIRDILQLWITIFMLKQVDLEKQMVIEDETLEDVSIDELRDSLCEHEPRFPISFHEQELGGVYTFDNLLCQML